MPAESRENPLLKKGNSDAFFKEKYLTKNRFPDDYIIDRDYTGKTYPRSEQVKRCGNAVCPPIPAALVKANLSELCVTKRTKI